MIAPVADLHFVMRLVSDATPRRISIAWSTVGGSIASIVKRRSRIRRLAPASCGRLRASSTRGADLAAREERLEQVADAAAGRALPEERVDPADIEERLGAPALARDRRDDPFAAALRSRRGASLLRRARRCRARGCVMLREILRNVARRDAHGERADDRRLSDARLRRRAAGGSSGVARGSAVGAAPRRRVR